MTRSRRLRKDDPPMSSLQYKERAGNNFDRLKLEKIAFLKCKRTGNKRKCYIDLKYI